MAVVVVTQSEFDCLWQDLKPTCRVFGEERCISLGEDIVVVGSPLSLKDLRRKLADADKLSWLSTSP